LKTFKTQHWSGSLLDKAMILLNDTVKAFDFLILIFSFSAMPWFQKSRATLLLPLLPIVTLARLPLCLIAFLKKSFAATASLLAISKKSLVSPWLSAAQYK
jgi:hypothetical protein